jgi:hypothetical protein
MKEKYKIKDPVTGLYFSIKDMPEVGDTIMYRKGGNGTLTSASFNPLIENHILNTFFNSRGRVFYSKKKVEAFIESIKDENLSKILKKCVIIKLESHD